MSTSREKEGKKRGRGGLVGREDLRRRGLARGRDGRRWEGRQLR